MSEREQILSALGPVGPPSAAPKPEPAGYVAPAEDLWKQFRLNLEALGGRLADLAVLDELVHKHKWVDAAAKPFVGAETDVAEIWDAEVGFALARCAVAQTGTLLFASGPESHRLTTLVPPINVVLVHKNSILPTLEESLRVVAASDRTCVFVTGPSRTADIEGVLVRGIHGPGELIVCVLES